MGQAPEERSGLWTFMLEFYALPGVAPACLRLQDTYQLDIPLFLAVLRAASLGTCLDAEEFRELDRKCAGWRDAVIRPLRSIRRAMKADAQLTAEDAAPELREDIKRIELRAERIEIDMLERLLAELPLADHPDIPGTLHSAARLMLGNQVSKRIESLPADAAMIVDTIASFAERARKS